MGEGGALSLFRFHFSPFPPETPDTQATNPLSQALDPALGTDLLSSSK